MSADYSLPEITETLFNKKKAVQSELDGLPNSFADAPQAKLLTLCNEFIARIAHCTSGNENQPDLFLKVQAHFRKLKESLSDTKPGFDVGNVKPKSPQKGRKKQGASFST